MEYQYAFDLDYILLVLVNVKKKNQVYILVVDCIRVGKEKAGGGGDDQAKTRGAGVIDGKTQKGKLVYIEKKVCRFILFVPL